MDNSIVFEYILLLFPAFAHVSRHWVRSHFSWRAFGRPSRNRSKHGIFFSRNFSVSHRGLNWGLWWSSTSWNQITIWLWEVGITSQCYGQAIPLYSLVSCDLSMRNHLPHEISQVPNLALRSGCKLFHSVITFPIIAGHCRPLRAIISDRFWSSIRTSVFLPVMTWRLYG